MTKSQLERIQVLPDAPRTLNGIANQGYTPQTAIADILDNSISAGATEIDIFYLVQLDGSTIVQIVDNGVGMNLETLRAAMQIGSSSALAKSDLSVYGIGMKAASMSFSRKFTVVTRESGGDILQASWDMDEQAEQPWTIEIGQALSENVKLFEEKIPGGHGTIISWDKADFSSAIHDTRVFRGRKKTGDRGLAQTIQEYLSMVFHRFLDGEAEEYRKLTIRFNSEELLPWNPVNEDFLSPNWRPIEDKFSLDIETEDGLVVVPYVMKTYVILRKDESSQDLLSRSKYGMKTQGIYPYRSNRLLQNPEWLDTLTFHPDLNALRVVLEVDPRMDHILRTDMKKSGLQLSSEMWEQMKPKLDQYSTQLKNQHKAKKSALRAKVNTTNLHDQSNAAINDAMPSLDPAVPTIQSDGTVAIHTMFGDSVTELASISPALISPDARISPSADLDGGVLFEPVLQGSDPVILLNKSHPFYQKIYLGVYQVPLAIQGFDFLLYALAHAELLTRTDRMKEQFRRMRMEMSEALRQFVVDLEEPRDFDEDIAEIDE